MRSVSIVLALAMVMAPTLAFLTSSARALEPQKLTVKIEAGEGAQLIFNPATIILPQVPIFLNVTLFNNGTVEHTFTINDNAGTPRISIKVTAHGDRAFAEFEVTSANQIVFGAQPFQAEAASTGGIKFYCVPHKDLGMIGSIVVGGTTTAAAPEIGVFLRAYWIGLIGLAAMLVWTGIAYFIIKSSSRHLRDHHDHIRRGLP